MVIIWNTIQKTGIGNSQLSAGTVSDGNRISHIQVCCMGNKIGCSILDVKRHGGAIVCKASFNSV